MSSKDEFDESIPLDDLAIISEKYELDIKASEAIGYIMKAVPVGSLKAIIGEDYFLREVIKDVESGTPAQRSKALQMLGMYLGVLSSKKTAPQKTVEFTEE